MAINRCVLFILRFHAGLHERVMPKTHLFIGTPILCTGRGGSSVDLVDTMPLDPENVPKQDKPNNVPEIPPSQPGTPDRSPFMLASEPSPAKEEGDESKGQEPREVEWQNMIW